MYNKIMETPDISIIIPTYNRKYFIEEAIASTIKAVTGVNAEIIIIDDGSTDGTEQIIQNLTDHRIKYIKIPHKGAQNARNVGLHEARGNTVKFFDSDDLLLPDTASKEIDVLNTTNSDVVISQCIIRSFTRNSYSQKKKTLQNMQRSLLFNEIIKKQQRNTDDILIWGQRYLFRRQFVVNHNIHWTESFLCSQETDFVLQCAAYGAIISSYDFPTVIIRRNITDNHLSTEGTIMDRRERVGTVYLPMWNNIEQISRTADILNPDIRKYIAKQYHYCAKFFLRSPTVYKYLFKKIYNIYPSYKPDSLIYKIVWSILGPYMTDVVLNLTYPLKKPLAYFSDKICVYQAKKKELHT